MTAKTTYRYNDNWDCEVVTPNSNQKVSWGEPPQIAQTKADRRCGCCGAVRGEGYITKSGMVVPGGLELVFDRGDVFGARCLCRNCGFSF